MGLLSPGDHPRRHRRYPARADTLGVRGLVIALATLGLLRASFAAGDEDLRAPLRLRNQMPFNLLFLSPAPVGALTLERGEWHFETLVAYANTFAATDDLISLYQKDDFATFGGRVTLPVLQAVAAQTSSQTAFVQDGETMRANLSIAYGLGRRVRVEAEIPFLSHGGGFADATIEAYHERLSLPDGGRPWFERDRFTAGYVEDGEAVFFDSDPGGAGVGDVVLATRVEVWRTANNAAAVSVSADLKLPTGSAPSLRGSGSLDYGGSLQASWALARAALHAGYCLAAVGPWSLARGVDLLNPRSQFFTWTYKTGQRTAFLAQFLRSRGPFTYQHGSDLGRLASEISLGFRHIFTSGVALEGGFTENIDPLYNSPDIGVFLGVRHRSFAGGPPRGALPDIP